MWRQSLYNVHLAIIPLEADKEWKRQSSYITKQVLEMLNLNVFFTVQPGQVDELFGSLQSDNNSVVCYHPDNFRRPMFTSIPNERRSDSTATPEQITKFNMDATQRLEKLLEYYRNLASNHSEQNCIDRNIYRDEQLLLGEQQVSFILFMLLFSLPGLEQWKKLTDLLCSCDDMLHTRPCLFSVFTRNLRFQLETAPCDLFTDELSADNFLRSALEKLFDTADESSSLDASLKRNIERLKSFVISKFGWSFREGKIFFSTDGSLDDEPTYVPYESCASYLSTELEVEQHGASSTESLSKARSRAVNSLRSAESNDFQSRKQSLQQALDSVSPNMLP